jgi:hypothetical protein
MSIRLTPEREVGGREGEVVEVTQMSYYWFILVVPVLHYGAPQLPDPCCDMGLFPPQCHTVLTTVSDLG